MEIMRSYEIHTNEKNESVVNHFKQTKSDIWMDKTKFLCATIMIKTQHIKIRNFKASSFKSKKPNSLKLFLDIT
jgi:hypothetical protein